MAHRIVFVPDNARGAAGKLADAEIHFDEGLFAGLKLVGFAIWERKTGARTVTFPARQYSVNGERRSFALLRPSGDAFAETRPASNADGALRDALLAAYAAQVDDIAPAPPVPPVPAPVPTAPPAVTPVQTTRPTQAQMAGW